MYIYREMNKFLDFVTPDFELNGNSVQHTFLKQQIIITG